MAEKKLRFETLQIHGGLQPDDPTGARGVAIYPTAAYRFKSCEHAAKLFDLSEGGNIYTRLQNPTTIVYEQRIAALYGAVGALAVSSGMSAILIAVLSLAAEGDNIVASPFLYGGTFTQFRISLRRLGIDCRIARSERPEDFEALIDGRTKAIYAESMGNPSCTVSDMEALGKLAKRYDVPFIVDNTFGAAGYLCNPFEWGANIVVDSATKWINGHGTAMGGVIVDGGNYNWANGKFPQIDGPSEGYHGLNFHEAFGAAAFIVKCRVDGVRDLGCCPSPFDSYLMTLGLETLSLRVRHEVESARRLAEYCRNHPKVERVSFVGFESHPSYANAKKYFRFGSSAVFTIELKGTLDSTVRFVESLNLAAHMVMIGDSVTVVTHPGIDHAQTARRRRPRRSRRYADHAAHLRRAGEYRRPHRRLRTGFRTHRIMEPSIYKAPGPFVLETGHTLPELRIAYHTYGKPNAAYRQRRVGMPCPDCQFGCGRLVAAHGGGGVFPRPGTPLRGLRQHPRVAVRHHGAAAPEPGNGKPLLQGFPAVHDPRHRPRTPAVGRRTRHRPHRHAGRQFGRGVPGHRVGGHGAGAHRRAAS